MHKRYIFFILFLLVLQTSAKNIITVPPGYALIKRDTKVKIKYLSTQTNQYGAEMEIETTKDLFIKDDIGVRTFVAPKGSKGRIKITKVGGLKKDLVMDVIAYIYMTDGEVLYLRYNKHARRYTRKVLKAFGYINMWTPWGLAKKGIMIGYKRKTNPYNLPKKLYTDRHSFIRTGF